MSTVASYSVDMLLRFPLSYTRETRRVAQDTWKLRISMIMEAALQRQGNDASDVPRVARAAFESLQDRLRRNPDVTTEEVSVQLWGASNGRSPLIATIDLTTGEYRMGNSGRTEGVPR